MRTAPVMRTSISLYLIFALVVGLAAGVSAAEGEGWPGWLGKVPEGALVEVPPLGAGVPAPPEVLGYRLGERFTGWEEARGYLGELERASGRVRVWEYGETVEGRPLVLVAVSSEGNLGRLEEIRRDRGRLAEPEGLGAEERERLERETPVVVWLGYGIHGNETSSTEAALGTAYVLAAAGGQWAERLERVVVLIDPLENPDGRERYLAAYRQRRGEAPNPDPEAAEHREPWPGGRGNHYLFDLNRDWTWATQVETRHRLAELRRWEPQVVVDLHEMNPRSAYFFPPVAEPVLPAIDPAVVGWLDVFGRANAAAFDRAGWLWFKAESFDLYYPGYGDSYPSLRGAVGMTYEVGGGGRAGEALRLPDGSLLTLASRTARHLTASLATVAAAADRADELDRDFVAGRLAKATSAPVTYLWPAGAAEAEPLARLLALHGVRVCRLTATERLPTRRLAGRPGSGGPAGPGPGDDREPRGAGAGGGEPRTAFAAGTWAVTTAQPLGRLVHALMEPAALPEEYVERQRERAERNLDAQFYDVTAWALPLAFNLEAWAHDGVPASLEAVKLEPGPGGGGDGAERITADPDVTTAPSNAGAGEAAAANGGAGSVVPPGGIGSGGAVASDARLGWLIPWDGLSGYRAAARLLAAGVPLRAALTAVGLPGRTAGAGTLFAPRLGGPGDLDARVAAATAAEGVAAAGIAGSYGEGVSLGSNRVVAVRPPRVALVGGAGVSSTAFGALWHLLDQAVGLPVTRLDLDRLGDADLAGFTAVVLPDGDYGEGLGGKAGDALAGWLRRGGVLIASGDALAWLRARELSAVETWPPYDRDGGEPAGGGPAAAPAAVATDPEAPPEPDAVTRRLLATPGAVLATRLTPGHPLAAGLPSPPPVLFEGDRVWLPTGDPQIDVLTAVAASPVAAGFAWPEARERLAGALLVASEEVGDGRLVLFAQDPAFRGFWRSTMPLLLNAVLYSPSWGTDRY